ncbi:MAG: hypothetical protein JWN99_939 [Ilumatobacteraceae bacterium]|nr:hypothetical protein [Ilumatobacteraceae bacterium]
MSLPTAAVVGGVVAALVITGGVVAMSRGGDSGTAVAPTTNPVAAPLATDAPVPPSADVIEPVITVAATTTELVATTVPAVVTSIHLTSVAAATSVDIVPVDPGSSSTYSGPLPAFNIGIDCTADGCNFSLRTFAPGTVTDEGLTTIPAVAGRFVSTSTTSVPCTGSNGTRFARNISSVIDLTLSGSQTVNGIAVPQQIGGTLTTITPEAGYVPHVGDVVDPGAERGCVGQTVIFTVAGDLTSTN